MCVRTVRDDRVHGGCIVGREGGCTWACARMVVTNVEGNSGVGLTCDRQVIGKVIVGGVKNWGRLYSVIE